MWALINEQIQFYLINLITAAWLDWIFARVFAQRSAGLANFLRKGAAIRRSLTAVSTAAQWYCVRAQRRSVCWWMPSPIITPQSRKHMKRIFGHSFHCHDLPEKTARSRLQAAIVCSRPLAGEESAQDENTADYTPRPHSPNLFSSTAPFPSFSRTLKCSHWIRNYIYI